MIFCDIFILTILYRIKSTFYNMYKLKLYLISNNNKIKFNYP